jgi:site-specific recombinase XerD
MSAQYGFGEFDSFHTININRERGTSNHSRHEIIRTRFSSRFRAAYRDRNRTYRAGCIRTMPQDRVFCTANGTPLGPKNLYNRMLAPACDSAKLPHVSWHSFRRGNATLLGEVGESIKTAQAILGHSDIGA